jgi:NAD(P)-dependent dehydrogenase (short-subunit alcohol dehydrogenase family)
MQRFDGKTTLVVGGANGIGAAISLRFASEGANVVVADLDADAGQALADSLDNGLFVHCDVRDEDQMEAAVAAAFSYRDRLDIAVHSAYQNTKVGIRELSRSDWDEITNTLLRSAFVLTQAVLPHLIEAPDGNLVHVASGAAVMGSRRGVAYGVSKAGLLGLMRYTAVEFGDQGVRCNAVLPGLIVVDRNRELWTTDPDALARATAPVPLQRSGEPDEIAAAVAFLASSDASFVTGVALPADGGAQIAPPFWGTRV